MGSLMDLVAGDTRRSSWRSPSRTRPAFTTGTASTPTLTWVAAWTQRGSICSVSRALGRRRREPSDFLDAAASWTDPRRNGDRTVERVDRRWVEAVARIPDSQVDALAGRWIDLLEEELGLLPREEKPWIRDRPAVRRLQPAGAGLARRRLRLAIEIP